MSKIDPKQWDDEREDRKRNKREKKRKQRKENKNRKWILKIKPKTVLDPSVGFGSLIYNLYTGFSTVF